MYEERIDIDELYKGRMSRYEYFRRVIIFKIIAFVICSISTIILFVVLSLDRSNEVIESALAIFLAIIMMTLLLTGIFARGDGGNEVRRLHDINISGYNRWITRIPIVGFIILLRPSVDPNKYDS